MADTPWISTPDYLKGRAFDIHTWVQSLNDDIARQKDAGTLAPDAPQLKAWRAWRDGWADWYGKTDGNTWLWGATGETLDTRAAEVNKWRDWYSRAFGSAPSMVPGAANPDDSRTGSKALLFALGAGVLGTILVARALR